MAILERAKAWARRIKADVAALAIAARDPRTPWIAKALAVAIVAYALSPIDLIPDFVPILGYLDDLILLPAGILLVIRLIPATLMQEFRAAANEQGRLPRSRAGVLIVIGLWVIGCAGLAWLILRRVH